jgi:lupus La protein
MCTRRWTPSLPGMGRTCSYANPIHRQEYCDIKIKEKGLSSRAASHQWKLITHGKGFDAFWEIGKDRKVLCKEEKKEEKKDVYLEFMGMKILIHQDKEGNSDVKEEDVPFMKGATLKFDGCGGEVIWSEIKVCR